MKRIIIGISGASAVGLGFRFVEILPNDIDKFLVISNGAKSVIKAEKINITDVSNINKVTIFDDADMGARISSGSFVCDAMAIVPCSSNTLAKISCGISDTLITRAAHVMIKERRKLLIAPREMPFSSIMLDNMLKLSQLGVIVSPPIFGTYGGSAIEDIENLIFGKWCDSLGIEYNYKRWN